MIVNLTSQQATQEQCDSEVLDVDADLMPQLRELLTFNTAPSAQEIHDRAEGIARIAALMQARWADHVDRHGYGDFDSILELGKPHQAWIAGPVYLVPALDAALRAMGFEPVYEFHHARWVTAK